MTFTMVYFLYLSISRTAFDVFNCVDTKPSTGKLYMAAQPLEECGLEGGVQKRLQLPAALVLVFYCLGFPTLLSLVFWKRKSRIIADQSMRAHGRGDDPVSN